MPNSLPACASHNAVYSAKLRRIIILNNGVASTKANKTEALASPV